MRKRFIPHWWLDDNAPQNKAINRLFHLVVPRPDDPQSPDLPIVVGVKLR
jgi:hypothetical protein